MGTSCTRTRGGTLMVIALAMGSPLPWSSRLTWSIQKWLAMRSTIPAVVRVPIGRTMYLPRRLVPWRRTDVYTWVHIRTTTWFTPCWATWMPHSFSRYCTRGVADSLVKRCAKRMTTRMHSRSGMRMHTHICDRAVLIMRTPLHRCIAHRCATRPSGHVARCVGSRAPTHRSRSRVRTTDNGRAKGCVPGGIMVAVPRGVTALV